MLIGYVRDSKRTAASPHVHICDDLRPSAGKFICGDPAETRSIAARSGRLHALSVLDCLSTRIRSQQTEQSILNDRRRAAVEYGTSRRCDSSANEKVCSKSAVMTTTASDKSKARNWAESRRKNVPSVAVTRHSLLRITGELNHTSDTPERAHSCYTIGMLVLSQEPLLNGIIPLR